MLISAVYWLLSLALTSTTGIVTIVLVLLTVWSIKIRPKNLPPGPWGVLFLGTIPFFGTENAGMKYDKMSKKYNSPIVSFVFAGMPFAILCDYPAVKEAFVTYGDDFAGRPVDILKKVASRELKTVVFSEGEFWREHRRFMLSTLRDFGIGKSSLEPAILTEITYFLEALEKNTNAPFSMEDLIAKSICNNIVALELGKRFEYDDPDFTMLKHHLDSFIKISNEQSNIDVALPFLKYIPYIKEKLSSTKLEYHHKAFEDYMGKRVLEHKKTFVPGMKNDFINAYLTEQLERQAEGTFADMFDDETLVANLRVLFAAGTESTSDTLNWCFVYLILHQDIQRRVQKEIDDVIGPNRTPSYDDRMRMPYTEAFILEVHRKANAIILTVPHTTTRDVKFRGYDLPKGTIVFGNTWGIHHDEKVFSDSASFRPERFIDKNGKLKRPESVIPFSLGKRFCVGEPLARIELFLYLTSTLQKFTLKSPEGADQVTCQSDNGKLFNHPKPYKVKLLKRDT